MYDLKVTKAQLEKLAFLREKFNQPDRLLGQNQDAVTIVDNPKEANDIGGFWGDMYIHITPDGSSYT